MSKKPGNTQPAADENSAPNAVFRCASEGCPLHGTWTSSTNGEGPWFCFLHASVKASKRDEVTKKIHENVWIFRLYERVMQSDPSAWQNVRQLSKQFCERRGESDLAPTPTEKRSDYERRLRTELDKRCRPAKQLDTFEQEATAAAKASVGAISEFLPAAA